MKKYWKKGIFCFIYFVSILCIAYILKLPQQFDSYIYHENYRLTAHISLILYRVCIYLVFPFIITFFEKNKVKEKFSKLLLQNFNIQFITYALLTGIYIILGLDKVFGVEIFGSADAILFIAGFIFTAILDKNIPSLIETKNEKMN